MATLRPQLENIAVRQRAVLAACHERLDKLSDAQLRWAPDDKTWSIVVIIDHLLKVHADTSQAFMRVLQPAPMLGDETEKETPFSFFDRQFVNMLSPGAKFKISVPKAYEPVTHTGPSPAVVNRLYEEFEAFRVILEYADQKRLAKLKVTATGRSSTHSIIAYFDAVIQHDRYHWLQIESILRNREFPAE